MDTWHLTWRETFPVRGVPASYQTDYADGGTLSVRPEGDDYRWAAVSFGELLAAGDAPTAEGAKGAALAFLRSI